MPARLKIDVFSPLPPLPTEVANHSAPVLAALARHAEVRAWTDQEAWAPIEGVEVRRFTPDIVPATELNAADAIFYNLGNNSTFHKGIHAIARRVPGVVVLHDTCLQNFFAYYGVQGGEAASIYFDAMRHWHGEAALEEARRLVAGEVAIETLMPRYPLTLEAAEGATGVIVHNEAEAAALAGRTRLPVHYVPLSIDTTRLADPPARVRGPAPWRLIAFGFMGPNRRLASVLRALAAPELRGLYTFDIYGRLDDPGEVDALVAELDLGPQVTRHGYVEDEVLAAALDRADLAVNLRYPSMGEASASQLRIWGHALPSLVTRVGWYGALPEGVVFHVDPAREVEDIVVHLAAHARDPEAYAQAGRRGRQRLLALHRVEDYADALLRIAGTAAAGHARRAALNMARAAARRLMQMTGDAGAALPLIAPVAARIASLQAGGPATGSEPAGAAASGAAGGGAAAGGAAGGGGTGDTTAPALAHVVAD